MRNFLEGIYNLLLWMAQERFKYLTEPFQSIKNLVSLLLKTYTRNVCIYYINIKIRGIF